MYYVNVNDQYFRFVDVPGDGDCFYHSVLRDYELGKRFDDVQSLREFFTGMVSLWFENDPLLRSLFMFEGKDYKSWYITTSRKGTWATTFDMLVFSYVFKVNVVSVGNYLNGFIVNDMRLYFLMQNQHLEPSFQDLIPEKPVIHVFFHTFGSPLQKISNGNHFAYLEPIPTPNFLVGTNTIKVVGGKSVEEKKKYQFASLEDWVSKKRVIKGATRNKNVTPM